MSPLSPHTPRILIVDDNEDIHRDFRQILTSSAKSSVHSRLDDLEAAILGEPVAPAQQSFELVSAFQGADALAHVQQAMREGNPYALAFIDMRMPPGWDGLETITRLWQEDPFLQAILCSAYSDYSWEALHNRFGKTDRLLILKKPFDPVEVRQMAWALVERWKRDTAARISEQTMRKHEAAFQALLQVLPDALVRASADGTCLDFQAPSQAPAFQWPAFLPGRKLSEILPAEAARQLLSQLHQALSNGSQQVFQHEQPIQGGQRRFESRLAAAGEGEVLILVRDITQR